jgi:hypothetical protein
MALLFMSINNWYYAAIKRFIKKQIMRSLSRRCINRVFAPEGEILSFAPPKESIQRKGGSIAAASCAPRFLSGVGREGFLPSYRRAASMPRPFGLIPTKPAVLGAANESKTTLLRNVSKHYIKHA